MAWILTSLFAREAKGEAIDRLAVINIAIIPLSIKRLR